MEQRHFMSQVKIDLRCFGHGIVDVDTEELIEIGRGEVVTTTVSDIVRGQRSNPGEIKGSIADSETLGQLFSNTHFGIYGVLTDREELNIPADGAIEVASRQEIETGKAHVVLNLEDGVRKEYDIEVVRIFKNNNSDNKSMLIRITDERLLRSNRGNSTTE